MDVSFDDSPYVDLETRISRYEDAASSPYVKSHEYSIGITVGSSELKKAKDEVRLFSEDPRKNFSLTGTSYAPLQLLEEGKATLVEGCSFTQEEIDQGALVVLLTEDFATLNGIELGDSILLKHYPMILGLNFTALEPMDIPLEVIGIYEKKDVPALDFER